MGTGEIPQEILDEIGENLDWQAAFLSDADQHIRCPRHDDKHPSLFVDKDHAFCFGGGCGAGWYGGLGAAMLLLETEYGLRASQVQHRHLRVAVKKLQHWIRTGDKTLRRREQKKEQRRTHPIPTAQVMDWVQSMKPEHYAWLHRQYAISEEVASTAHLGFTGTAIAIPHSDIDGRVWDVKFRFYEYEGFEGEPNLRYWSTKGGSPRNLYPGWVLKEFWARPEYHGQVGITESELDALSLLSHSSQLGLALPNGGGTKVERWSAFWRVLAEHDVVVHLLLDNDEPGDKATQSLMTALSEFDLNVQDSRELLGESKDVAAHYVDRRQRYETIQL